MAVYVLKNLLVDSSISKYDAFSYDWMRWFRFARFAPSGFEFQESDIVIANIYNGDPFSGYDIPSNTKKIFIMHDCNKNTIPVLAHAGSVIFMNRIQADIVKNIVGFSGKSITVPRFPLHEFPTSFPKENSVYIGGWYSPVKMDGFIPRIEELFTLISRDTRVNCRFVIGDSSDLQSQFAKFRNDVLAHPPFANRITVEAADKTPYEKMLFTLRTSKHVFLWNNELNINEITSMLNFKDSKILLHNVSESAMLAHAQSAGCNIFLENRISFLPFFEKVLQYTYKDFAASVLDAVNIL